MIRVTEILIQQVFPDVIGGTASLAECLTLEARTHGITDQFIKNIIGTIQNPLVNAPCFFDRMTGLWRYEFGIPFNLDKTKTLQWGTHMWCPVAELFSVLMCAHNRLSANDRALYLGGLADINKHRDRLVEIFPVLRVAPSVPLIYEAKSRGQGNKTIDWLLEPPEGRPILFDVKRRVTDLIKMMDTDTIANDPQHDPAILFKSIENKFLSADPDTILQGAWITTEIKQENTALRQAFDQLNHQRVHFVVLGDAEDDAFMLVRRNDDEKYLRDMFKAKESARFTFNYGDP